MPGLDERVIAYRGGRIRYLFGGTGPPLVLCHGFLGSAENFATWFDRLSMTRTLVIPDLPGCGDSTPLRGTAHHGSSLAAAVEAVVDHEGLHRYDLGGLCLGTPVAMALLHSRPRAVTGLILHTPLLAPALVRRSFHRQVRAMLAPGLFPAVVWLSRRRVVSDLYKRLVVEGDNVDPTAAEANFRNQLRADPRALREWLRHGLSRDDVALLRRSRVPTLILAATADRIVDVAALRATVDEMPRVTLAAVDDAGHGWTDAYVRRQLEVIESFLQGGVSRAPRTAVVA